MHKATCDGKGRLYLRRSVRSRYGEKFIFVETPQGLQLLPVPSDPVKDLQQMGRALEGRSIEELRETIRRRAIREAAPSTRWSR